MPLVFNLLINEWRLLFLENEKRVTSFAFSRWMTWSKQVTSLVFGQETSLVSADERTHYLVILTKKDFVKYFFIGSPLLIILTMQSLLPSPHHYGKPNPTFFMIKKNFLTEYLAFWELPRLPNEAGAPIFCLKATDQNPAHDLTLMASNISL